MILLVVFYAKEESEHICRGLPRYVHGCIIPNSARLQTIQSLLVRVTQISGCLAVGVGAGRGGRDAEARLQKARRKLLGVLDVFTIFVAMIS